MAQTAAVYARIDAQLKQNAEEILAQLGITPAAAIQMFYSQIVLTNGLPFAPCLPQQPAASSAATAKSSAPLMLTEADKALAQQIHALRTHAHKK